MSRRRSLIRSREVSVCYEGREGVLEVRARRHYSLPS